MNEHYEIGKKDKNGKVVWDKTERTEMEAHAMLNEGDYIVWLNRMGMHGVPFRCDELDGEKILRPCDMDKLEKKGS